MNDIQQSTITARELEVLKQFTMSFMTVYSFMPPKEFLGIFLTLHRLAMQLETLKKSIPTITIAQAPTLDAFHAQAIANIQSHRSMMR